MADITKTVENAASAAAKAPMTVIGWIKAHPVIFTLLLLFVAVLVLRYASTIRNWIARIPFGGSRLASAAEERSGTA